VRREPFALPFPEDVPSLAAVLLGGTHTAGQPARFLEAAERHNVVAFVLAAAQEGRVRLPAPAPRQLADGHLGRIARTALLRREAARIAPVITAACGASPVVVKGPSVGDRFYSSWQQRPYSDIDLMVPASSLAGAVEALGSLGYGVMEELRPGYAERFGHDVHVRRMAGTMPVDVELHWRIGDDRVGTPLGHAHLIRSAVPLGLDGGAVVVPAVADQLLLLSVHLLSDRGKRLSWVNDVRLVAQAASEEEWNGAFATAEALGGGLPWVLHRALDYARHYLGLVQERPFPPGPPPRYGPLRAVEELDLRASPHVGRLVALRGAERLRYLQAIAVPTRAGLEGTVGGDGARLPTLVARHAGRALRGVTRRRD
jgi:hypothetical protein